jgi:hypothetical protein
VLKTLIHRQDDHFPRARQLAVVEQAGEVGQRAWVIATVPA